MKGFVKTIFSVFFLILFLVLCFVFFSIVFFAAWLHTYKAFTGKTALASVTISEAKLDNQNRSYADVEIVPFKLESALNYFVRPSNSTVEQKLDKLTFKVYGDAVYIGGPVIKFHDNLVLLNFKSIFKIGKLFGRYELDNNLELNRTPEIASSFDINNGIADWSEIFDRMRKDDLLGKIYKTVIDNLDIKYVGQLVSNEKFTYTLYINNAGNGFSLELE